MEKEITSEEEYRILGYAQVETEPKFFLQNSTFFPLACVYYS